MSMIQNLSQSLHLQQQQLQALEAAVAAATRLWQFPREKRTVDYLDVPLPAPRPVDKPPANAPESPLSGTPQAPESPLPPRRANPEIRTDPQEPAAPADKPSR